jgi:asparagine synthase (glutamine-hydrolysing)
MGGETLVAARDGVTVISDASIYYREDLVSALERGGETPASASSADVIVSAYRLWRDDCAQHLEGDFAFVLWDANRRAAMIARDFVGRRPLMYAMSRSGDLAIASSARAVAAHRDVRAPINRITIAASLSGLLGGSKETGFVGVVPVPAGGTMIWSPDRGLRLENQWQAPAFSFGGRGGATDAAMELRELFQAAVKTRLGSPVTSVWLSGGADSTAVFAAAQSALRATTSDARVLPVSISYPEGDSARENEHINATSARWSTPVRWIDSNSVSLLSRLVERARERDDPYAHTHESMNRALARASRESGAHVAMDGYGGDQLFYVSHAVVADLFASLRWISLRRMLRELDIRGTRSVIRWAVLPLLPQSALDLLGKLRGRPFGGDPGQSLPSWLNRGLARDPALLARTSREPARRLLEGAAAYESRWYVRSPYFPRAVSWATAFALREGIEVRSPILDQRIIHFAASRPVLERAPLEGGKALVRQAMKGLVPDSVLAPRPQKTGIPRAYFHQRMREEFAAVFANVFDAPGAEVRLADLGLIDLDALRRAHANYEGSGEHFAGIQLYLTLQAEVWLRAIGT